MTGSRTILPDTGVRILDVVVVLPRCAFVLGAALGACDSGTAREPSAPPAPMPPVPRPVDAQPVADAPAPDTARRRSPAELKQFDLDADGVADDIDVGFSGGAHCCYTLSITPSKSRTRVSLPFELDGGYVGGLSLAQPRVFNIADYDHDGIVEICAQIQTYNGEENPLPRAWTKRYGIRTHWVEIRFATGALVVRDHGATTCEPT